MTSIRKSIDDIATKMKMARWNVTSRPTEEGDNMIITLALTAGLIALALLLTDYRIDRRDNEKSDYNDNEKRG